MDQADPIMPSRVLLRQAFAIGLANANMLVPLSGISIIVLTCIITGFDPAMQAIGLHYDDAKATIPQFLLYDGLNNLALNILINPSWAGVYGVAFAILRKDPRPSRGFAAAWTTLLPVLLLGLITDIPSIAIDYGLRHTALGDESPVSLIIYAILSAPIMLSLAAIVGLRMGAFRSVAYSLRRFEENPWLYFGYYLGAISMACVGVVFCGFGVMVTLPIFVMAMAMLVVERSALDEISRTGLFPRGPEA